MGEFCTNAISLNSSKWESFVPSAFLAQWQRGRVLSLWYFGLFWMMGEFCPYYIFNLWFKWESFVLFAVCQYLSIGRVLSWLHFDCFWKGGRVLYQFKFKLCMTKQGKYCPNYILTVFLPGQESFLPKYLWQILGEFCAWRKISRDNLIRGDICPWNS